MIMAAALSNEERTQLLQTVAMYEAVTESDSADVQSLETLKEAYAKLGRAEDSLRASKKLAQAYAASGQVSRAILEYEGVLEKFPNDEETRAALAALEPKARESAAPRVAPQAPITSASARIRDAERILGQVLIEKKILTPQALEAVLKKLQDARANMSAAPAAYSLAQIIADEHIAKLDEVLTAIVEGSNLPYLSLDNYDTDSDVVRLLPRDVALRYCTMPFDKISRTLLVATVNPFDKQAREEIGKLLDYNLQWYVCSPVEINAVLKRVHRLAPKKTT
jgi:tetratricopeptide (TPR) repeat protein